MDTLQQVLGAAAAGPRALETWADAHRSQIDVPLADAVYARAGEKLQAGELGDSAPLYFAAMVLYRVAGPEEKALKAAFNYLQCVYMAADSVAAYDTVRTQLLTIGKRARGGGHAETSFNCFVVAADSAFCAADLSQGAADWVIKSLEDLREAARGATAPLPQTQVELFTNVAANLWVLAKKADWGARVQAAEELLVSLAAESERLVPVGFTLPADPQKTRFIAVNLAELSDEYGNPNNAGERRAAALD